MRGFLVDVFQGVVAGRSAIFAAGRLENGESFALVDDRIGVYFYVRRSDRERVRSLYPSPSFALEESDYHTMDGEGLARLSFRTTAEMKRIHEDLLGKNIRCYEGDLDLTTRFRITHDIQAEVEITGESRSSQHVDQLYLNPALKAVNQGINLRALALDIETNADATRLLGLSLVAWELDGKDLLEEVHLIAQAKEGHAANRYYYKNEKDLLEGFLSRVLTIDPDIITGWNVIDFDLLVLTKLAAKHRVAFKIGRSRDISNLRQSKFFGKSRIYVNGRQVIDALQLVRFSLNRFEDHRLGTVAQELLGRGKTLSVEEWQEAPDVIMKAYKENEEDFCAYVLEDSRLVRDILRHEKLLELTMKRSQLTSLSMERNMGSIAAFEALYIAEMSKRKIAAPSLGVDMKEQWAGSGGLVLDPKVGLHEHVLIFDFKSLYPSVMRSFNIDPLAFTQGSLRGERSDDVIVAPNGAVFSREEGILPDLLSRFFEEREKAKARKDLLGSYSYKIIMNSFYGVLATDSCRFADMKMADAITGFGQQLLIQMQKYFNGLGLPVLYGDTDSLFVSFPEGKNLGTEDILNAAAQICSRANLYLAESLRQDYAIESKMELEFEKYYRFLFLPSDRQGDGGRAKTYAGLALGKNYEKLDIVGLEAVRSDWTPLAKTLQKNLLNMMFHGVEAKELVAHIRTVLKDMQAGRRDEELIYRKKIRRPIDSYTKTTPPHIKAARLLPKAVKVVRYHITKAGPEPIGFQTAPLDYSHYLEKQLRPIVEGLANFAGFDAETALDSRAGFLFTEMM
jgi:DNA polymerase-2